MFRKTDRIHSLPFVRAADQRRRGTSASFAGGATRACGASPARWPSAVPDGSFTNAVTLACVALYVAEPRLRSGGGAPATWAISTCSRRATGRSGRLGAAGRHPLAARPLVDAAHRDLPARRPAAHPLQRAVDPPARAGRRGALRPGAARRDLHRLRRRRLRRVQLVRRTVHRRRLGLDLRPAGRHGRLRTATRRRVRRAWCCASTVSGRWSSSSSGFFMSGVNNLAHAGGFVGGFAAGLVLSLAERRAETIARLAARRRRSSPSPSSDSSLALVGRRSLHDAPPARRLDERRARRHERGPDRPPFVRLTPAATYSPTPLPAQYHRPRRA